MFDKEFDQDKKQRIQELSENKELYRSGISWLKEAWDVGYAYNFNWLGVPIIKLPADVVCLQEIIFKCSPDIIIEAGVARGGSVVFAASILHLIKKEYMVIGIDVDVRQHTTDAIEFWTDKLQIKLIEGSSVDEGTINKVKQLIPEGAQVMVILDSAHHHDHVLKELQLFSPLVSEEQYLCCTDTFIEHFPPEYFPYDGPGNSPLTAIREFLSDNQDFMVDEGLSRKGMISENFDAYLIKKSL